MVRVFKFVMLELEQILPEKFGIIFDGWSYTSSQYFSLLRINLEEWKNNWCHSTYRISHRTVNLQRILALELEISVTA